MYKVLVVEDMDLTRADIVNMIEWKKYGYELLPDARNGRMGLEYAERYHPDIIITDIKMPLMTGLDMVEELRRRGSDAEILLLTAYEEFELAKRAMKMGIQNFILKYEIDEALLLKELNQLVVFRKRKIEFQNSKTRGVFGRLLTGQRERIGLEDSLLPWKGKAHLLYFKMLTEERIDISEENLQDLLETELNRYQFLFCRTGKTELFILLKLGQILSEIQMRGEAQEFASKVQELFQGHFQTSVAAASGGILQRDKEILPAKRKAEERMRGFVFFHGEVLLEDKVFDEKKALSEVQCSIIEEVRKCFEECREGEMTQLLKKNLYREMIRERNLSVWYALSKRLMGVMEEYVPVLSGQDTEEGMERLRERYKIYTLEQFIDEFLHTAGLIIQNADKKFSHKVRYIKSYVKKNYNKDISLNDLAEEIGMNAIYLSQLFKKEMGVTLSAYITRIRIEKAEQLLREGDYKIYEISEMVGYQTVQYFSKVFKKETGKSPKDFC